jgi:dihydrofolate synthase/folylpolyglutamate synthase
VTGWSISEALAALDAHVNLEAVVSGRVDAPTLDRARRLVELMGEPQRAYPVIHLTGTNGKGSTARMITALLAARGLSVGTYTSLDLEGVNERLTWNDEPISDEALAGVLEGVIRLEDLMAEVPSRFEVLTAAAYRWFSDIAVDAAVVEVGLGGRWDATNVADAEVAVVTNVSLDHAEILGPTLADIAWEKAGIVKQASTLVLGEQDPDLRRIFAQAGAAEVWERGRDFACERNRVAHGGRLVDLRTPGRRYEEVYLPLHGAHQGDNAATAVAAAEAFFGGPLAPDVVEEALAGVRVPGRMEVVSRRPLTILDGAHNPAGARAAAATLSEEFETGGATVLVIGLLRGREPSEMLAALGVDRAPLVIACPPPSPRAMSAGEVAEAAAAMGLRAVTAGTVADAVARAQALAGADDVVVVTGSLYVVGAARGVLVSTPA